MVEKNKIKEFESTSEADTAQIARDFADQLQPGDVVAFKGDLGSGKTFFVKKIAEKLGFDGYVSSPTFTILNIYETQIPLYHFDFYRLRTVDEIEKIGFLDLLTEDGIFLIEWPEKASSLLPSEYFEISIDIIEKNKRKIILYKIF